MSLRKEQCNKVCRILDDVLANRPTERDSLIVATRKAFDALSEPCEDAVSRLGAINHFREIANATSSKEEYNEGFIDGLEFCIAHLSTMPPVTPKQGSGYWILGAQDRVNGIWAKCSACGKTSFGGGSFCRECGAKMNPYKGRSNE